jgi:hypothetical protein
VRGRGCVTQDKRERERKKREKRERRESEETSIIVIKGPYILVALFDLEALRTGE